MGTSLKQPLLIRSAPVLHICQPRRNKNVKAKIAA